MEIRIPKDKTDDDILNYSDFVRQYLWMVRPCHEYADELKECKSLKGRFHQYYIHGALVDCTAWQKDAQNCDLCILKKNNAACEGIIENERERRMKRLIAHKKNDVWEKRESPPEEWNAPLPEFMLKKQKDSRFLLKSAEVTEYMAKFDPSLSSATMCTIL